MQVSKAPIARKAEQGKKKKSKEVMTELEKLESEQTSLVTSINTTRNKLRSIELAQSTHKFFNCKRRTSNFETKIDHKVINEKFEQVKRLAKAELATFRNK